LKAFSFNDAAGGLTLVAVNDDDLVGRPAQSQRARAQTLLAFGAFLVLWNGANHGPAACIQATIPRLTNPAWPQRDPPPEFRPKAGSRTFS
jgi:hypothetical protein